MTSHEMLSKLVQHFADEFHLMQIGESIFNENPHHQDNRIEAMIDLLTVVIDKEELNIWVNSLNSQYSD